MECSRAAAVCLMPSPPIPVFLQLFADGMFGRERTFLPEPASIGDRKARDGRRSPCRPAGALIDRKKLAFLAPRRLQMMVIGDQC